MRRARRSTSVLMTDLHLCEDRALAEFAEAKFYRIAYASVVCGVSVKRWADRLDWRRVDAVAGCANLPPSVKANTQHIGIASTQKLDPFVWK